MKAKLRSCSARALMTYLLSLGLTLTALGVTGLEAQGWQAAVTLAGLSLGAGVVSLDRRVALGAGVLTLFGGAVWLMIGGASVLGEVLQALMWHMSGLTTALPMVGGAFTMVICVMSAAAGWFVTQRSAGAWPAVLLLVMTAVLLWLGNRQDVLPCLLPSALCCMTLLLRAGDDNTRTLHVLPLAAVVTALAFAAAAPGGATSEPLKALADSLRQRIYDTFFYTQPRDVFTLATEGYYPQGMSQLGGPAVPREDPVMAVITPRKAYLRGVVKRVYTGRVWTDDAAGRRYLWTNPRYDELRAEVFDQNLPLLSAGADAAPLAPVTLQARMLRESASTLFVPQRLRAVTPEGSITPYFNASSEVFATRNLMPGDVWTMEAALFTSADASVRALVSQADGASDPRWPQICGDYLQLHENIDHRVYDMAREAAAQAVTPYDQALALQHWLAAYCTYTLEAPEQSPVQDFVSTFLVESREGYCTHFASAMTVMCRILGLPARYVEGYVAYPDETGLAVVTGKEGHAWTEVYFAGFGWVTFDATPTSVSYTALPPEGEGDGSDAPDQTPEAEAPDAPTPSPEPSPDVSGEPGPTPSPEAAPDDASAPEQPADSPQDTQGPGFPWGWLLLLLLAALLVRALLVQPWLQALLGRTEFRRWLAWNQAVFDALHRRGLCRDKAESPAAFLRRAVQTGAAPASLLPLADAQNLMFYGHADPYAEETALVRDCFHTLWRQLPPGQKALFQLRRIFLPAARRDVTRM